MTLALVLAVALLCVPHHPVSAVQYTPAALADKIDHLPGLVQQPSFNQFSGYLVLNETSQKSIFYWYVESQSNSDTDPLIWWSNGGPGCSGLMGLLTEHGPFRVVSGGGLEPFAYSWNTIANVLYVEAPCGVGFSFSNDPNDYNANDASTATDNHASIKLFFERFPHLVKNDFYISAESYGGHYVPTLAHTLLRAGDVPTFRGFFLGNPKTDPVEQLIGAAQTLCGHALASQPSCARFFAACFPQPWSWNVTVDPKITEDGPCHHAMFDIESINTDDSGLDWPICTGAATSESAQARRIRQMRHANRRRRGLSPRLPAASKASRRSVRAVSTPYPLPLPPAYDPCIEQYDGPYLNRPDVRAALHVNPAVGQWSDCDGPCDYDWGDDDLPMEPLYPSLAAAAVKHDLRLVIFSGDSDTVCSTLGTQMWMFNLLGDQIVVPWKGWTYESFQYGTQTGGAVVQFKGISLVTVHNGGHEVSRYQPERGLAALVQFLNGTFTSTSQTHPKPNRDRRNPIDRE